MTKTPYPGAPNTGKPRGFAAMDPERHREIASRGGSSVKPQSRYFNDRKAASAAGRLGGLARHRKPGAEA